MNRNTETCLQDVCSSCFVPYNENASYAVRSYADLPSQAFDPFQSQSDFGLLNNNEEAFEVRNISECRLVNVVYFVKYHAVNCNRRTFMCQ